MEEIINKILENYQDYLTEEQIAICLHNPSEVEVRSIVNTVWNQFLTNPHDFQIGMPFKFLINKGINLFEPIPFAQYPIFTKEADFIYLISDENINEQHIGTHGLVVDIDWMQTDKILLPVDLLNYWELIKGKQVPTAIFNLNMGEGIISPGLFNDIELAKETHLILLDINKKIYVPNLKLSRSDYKGFLNDVITLFMVNNSYKMDTNKRDELVLKYGSFILTAYKEALKNNSFEPNLFMALITKHINGIKKDSITKSIN